MIVPVLNKRKILAMNNKMSTFSENIERANILLQI